MLSEYRLLSELDVNTKEKVGELLLSSNTWSEVAFELNMSRDEIDIRGDGGRDVMKFLVETKPDLKVYDFCKILKKRKIQRFDIINVLLDHLSVRITYV